eukprot:5428667-Amphidinium_carterae.1
MSPTRAFCCRKNTIDFELLIVSMAIHRYLCSSTNHIPHPMICSYVGRRTMIRTPKMPQAVAKTIPCATETSAAVPESW